MSTMLVSRRASPRRLEATFRNVLWNSRSAASGPGCSSSSGTFDHLAKIAAFGTSTRALSTEHERLLIIGSGVAGSAAALIAAELHDMPVTLVYAGSVPTDCNSYWAQGGIIYRNYDVTSGDSAALLATDIQRAGAGLCNADAVNMVSTQGPDRVRQLLLDSNVFANVPFDRDDASQLSLCLEASHSAPRILYKADHTGRIITEHLCAAVARHPLITPVPHTVVTDLIVNDNVCVGIDTLERRTGRSTSLYAQHGVVLASGGLAGIYEHSTNPAGFNALGSSVALASRAQVATADLEFVQFHPTSLFIPGEARFLLTEALRGEGAVLRDARGRAFAADYHSAAELAPRDVVARAVFAESQKADTVHNVYLDITHRDAHWLHGRFPTIRHHLQQRGLDLARDQLPIIPAAHYTCGGVATDLHGRTSLPNLYAAGEAARTGLHGGNRLASTSLLEGLVFGAAVADYCASDAGRDVAAHAAACMNTPRTRHNARHERESHSWLEPSHIENAAYRSMRLLKSIRRTMWDHVGVVRTLSGLDTAMELLSGYRDEANASYASCPTLETAAVRDAASAGLAVATAAAANRNSVGAHCIVPDVESDEDEMVMAAAR